MTTFFVLKGMLAASSDDSVHVAYRETARVLATTLDACGASVTPLMDRLAAEGDNFHIDVEDIAPGAWEKLSGPKGAYARWLRSISKKLPPYNGAILREALQSQ